MNSGGGREKRFCAPGHFRQVAAALTRRACKRRQPVLRFAQGIVRADQRPRPAWIQDSFGSRLVKAEGGVTITETEIMSTTSD